MPERRPADARPLLSRPRSRAAILFAGAAVVGACSSASDNAVPAYGVAVVDSGIEQDSGRDSPIDEEGGPVAMYGPAPVDSGQDTGSDADAGDASDDG